MGDFIYLFIYLFTYLFMYLCIHFLVEHYDHHDNQSYINNIVNLCILIITADCCFQLRDVFIWIDGLIDRLILMYGLLSM